MGLSAPLALLAAALVALPIVAHLVRRADVERRVLPTVALLRRVVVRDRRRARVTEPYLLALRIAAVALAAIALAGPFVVDRLAYGDGSALSVVIVVDDSASMAQRTRGERTALDEARERARDVVRSVGEGSELALVAAGSPPRLLVPRSADRDAVLAALDRMRVGARRTDLEGAASLAARQLASAHLAARRVVVISDFAVPDEATLRGRAGAEFELVAVAPADPPTPNNVGISDVRAVPDPLEADAWSVTVELSAFGADFPPGVDVVVLALPPDSGSPEGATELAELARTRAELDAGHGRALLRFRPPDGVTHVALRLTETQDASPFDDVRVVALGRPRVSRVVLVEPSGVRTARFAARALAAVPEEAGGFLATAVDADHLAIHRAGRIDPEAEPRPDPLADADVVVLAGVVPSSPSALEAIRAFVDGGGGLLVAPSSTTRAFDLSAIGELLPAEAGELSPVEASPGPALLSGEGPALLPPGPTGLESLAVHRRLALTAAANLVALRFGSGEPFLILDTDRRRAILAVSLDDELSDLPLRVGFVPLLASLTRALARPGALPDRPFAAGEAPHLRVDSAVSAVEVVTPTGEVLARTIARGAVSLDDLAEPGAYRIRVEEAGRVRELERAALVLVPPASEIDLTPRPPPEERPRSERGLEGEARRPLERWFFLSLGLLAAIEAFARLGRRRSAPVTPATR